MDVDPNYDPSDFLLAGLPRKTENEGSRNSDKQLDDTFDDDVRNTFATVSPPAPPQYKTLQIVFNALSLSLFNFRMKNLKWVKSMRIWK